MTRLGLHANTNNQTDMLLDYCRRVKPNAVKLLDPNRDVVRRIKDASPSTIVIGRKYWADQRADLSNYGEFRGAAVSLAVDSGVDYMEGYNEFCVEDQNLSTFAGAEVSLAKALNARGIGALIGGFSTGYLDSNPGRAWRKFGQAFDYMQSVGPKCALHFHEYSNYLQYGVITPDGCNQWRNGWTGFSARKETYWEPKLEGWWTLRYRMLWAQLRAAGYGNIYGMITEFGTDDVNPRPGEAGRKGWRDWIGTQWFTSSVCGDFVDQCQWYMWQVSHDPYILGVVDFGFATADPTWLSFDFAHMPAERERLIATQAKLAPGIIPPSSATPVAPPIPTPSVPGATMPTTAGRFVCVEIARGEGRLSVARRAYDMTASTPFAQVAAAQKRLEAANPGALWRAGDRLIVPGWKAVPV